MPGRVVRQSQPKADHAEAVVEDEPVRVDLSPPPKKKGPAKVHEFQSEPIPADDDDVVDDILASDFVNHCAKIVERDWGRKPGDPVVTQEFFGAGTGRYALVTCRWEY